jgi:CheY-like chemotaxis protein
LQQVVWNLLANAIKFTPKGGRVEIRLQRVNSHVEIVVSDNGQGIKTEFLPHIFERFRQADGAITRTQGGLGLGLAIARHLVESHGGTIHADSPGEGQGSVFIVQLPLMPVRAADTAASGDGARVHPAAAQGATTQPTHSLAGVRVLAVDDQPDTLEMIAAILTGAGASVQTEVSAADALATLKRWQPDLLIADIGLPGEDGYALIGQVRALAPEQGGNTPAIALTAYARVEDRLRTLSAGFQMHVPKPVEPAELTTIVASLTGKTGTEAGA